MKRREILTLMGQVIELFVTDLEKLVTEIDPIYWRDAIRCADLSLTETHTHAQTAVSHLCSQGVERSHSAHQKRGARHDG